MVTDVALFIYAKSFQQQHSKTVIADSLRKIRSPGALGMHHRSNLLNAGSFPLRPTQGR